MTEGCPNYTYLDKLLCSTWNHLLEQTEQIDFEKYGTYVDVIKKIFVPSLEHRVRFLLEHFVYGEKFKFPQHLFDLKQWIHDTTLASLQEQGNDCSVELNSALPPSNERALENSQDSNISRLNYIQFFKNWEYVNQNQFWIKSDRSTCIPASDLAVEVDESSGDSDSNIRRKKRKMTIHTMRKMNPNCEFEIKEDALGQYLNSKWSCRDKHDSDRWMEEKLKLKIRIIRPTVNQDDAFSKSIKVQYLRLPCKAVSLLDKMRQVDKCIIDSSSQEFQENLYNCVCKVVHYLNDILCRMDYKNIRNMCLFCQVRPDYVSFKLKPMDQRKVYLISAKVTSSQPFIKCNDMSSHSIRDRYRSVEGESSKNSENCKIKLQRVESEKCWCNVQKNYAKYMQNLVKGEIHDKNSKRPKCASKLKRRNNQSNTSISSIDNVEHVQSAKSKRAECQFLESKSVKGTMDDFDKIHDSSTPRTLYTRNFHDSASIRCRPQERSAYEKGEKSPHSTNKKGDDYETKDKPSYTGLIMKKIKKSGIPISCKDQHRGHDSRSDSSSIVCTCTSDKHISRRHASQVKSHREDDCVEYSPRTKSKSQNNRHKSSKQTEQSYIYECDSRNGSFSRFDDHQHIVQRHSGGTDRCSGRDDGEKKSKKPAKEKKKDKSEKDKCGAKSKDKSAAKSKSDRSSKDKCESSSKNKSDSKSVEKCPAATKEKCESKPADKCQQPPKDKCDKKPADKCQQPPKDKCDKKPADKCQQPPKDKCEEKPADKCQQPPKDTCDKKPADKCQQPPKDKCDKKPADKCQQPPKDKCDKKPADKCQQPPKDKCEEKPADKCQQPPKDKCDKKPADKCQQPPKDKCDKKPEDKCQQPPKDKCDKKPEDKCKQPPKDKCDKKPADACPSASSDTTCADSCGDTGDDTGEDTCEEPCEPSCAEKCRSAASSSSAGCEDDKKSKDKSKKSKDKSDTKGKSKSKDKCDAKGKSKSKDKGDEKGKSKSKDKCDEKRKSRSKDKGDEKRKSRSKDSRSSSKSNSRASSKDSDRKRKKSSSMKFSTEPCNPCKPCNPAECERSKSSKKRKSPTPDENLKTVLKKYSVESDDVNCCASRVSIVEPKKEGRAEKPCDPCKPKTLVCGNCRQIVIPMQGDDSCPCFKKERQKCPSFFEENIVVQKIKELLTPPCTFPEPCSLEQLCDICSTSTQTLQYRGSVCTIPSPSCCQVPCKPCNPQSTHSIRSTIVICKTSSEESKTSCKASKANLQITECCVEDDPDPCECEPIPCCIMQECPPDCPQSNARKSMVNEVCALLDDPLFRCDSSKQHSVCTIRERSKSKSKSNIRRVNYIRCPAHKKYRTHMEACALRGWRNVKNSHFAETLCDPFHYRSIDRIKHIIRSKLCKLLLDRDRKSYHSDADFRRSKRRSRREKRPVYGDDSDDNSSQFCCSEDQYCCEYGGADFVRMSGGSDAFRQVPNYKCNVSRCKFSYPVRKRGYIKRKVECSRDSEFHVRYKDQVEAFRRFENSPEFRAIYSRSIERFRATRKKNVDARWNDSQVCNFSKSRDRDSFYHDSVHKETRMRNDRWNSTQGDVSREIDRDFMSKLTQYVKLCKNVRHLLVKKSRPDDVYDVSSGSIPYERSRNLE